MLLVFLQFSWRENGNTFGGIPKEKEGEREKEQKKVLEKFSDTGGSEGDIQSWLIKLQKSPCV